MMNCVLMGAPLPDHTAAITRHDPPPPQFVVTSCVSSYANSTLLTPHCSNQFTHFTTPDRQGSHMGGFPVVPIAHPP